jgi:hypothetical protein
MDSSILKSAVWQAENFVDRTAFLQDSTGADLVEGVKSKVVLVSSDRTRRCSATLLLFHRTHYLRPVRVKAQERELETGDVSVLASLV